MVKISKLMKLYKLKLYCNRYVSRVDIYFCIYSSICMCKFLVQWIYLLARLDICYAYI